MTSLQFWQAIYIEAYKLRGISSAKDDADFALKQLEDAWEMNDTIEDDDTPPIQYPSICPSTITDNPSTMEEYDNMPIPSPLSIEIKKEWDKHKNITVADKIKKVWNKIRW